MRIVGGAAFAKINLGLEILGRRNDGFHDLNTLFVRTSVAEPVSAASRDDSRIEVRMQPDLGVAPRDNIVYKAATALQSYYPQKPGATIFIEKRIPSGAGLGGGSSDAAATLKLLRMLWADSEGAPDEVPLMEMAAGLGSDVPFFLHPSPAIGAGRGTELRHIPHAVLPYAVLMIHPEIHVSTAWAYGAVSDYTSQPTDFAAVLGYAAGDPMALSMLRNDFERPVFSAFPLLGELRDALLRIGAHAALMSGSGSTLTGIFDTAEEAARAARAFPDFHTSVATLAVDAPAAIS